MTKRWYSPRIINNLLRAYDRANSDDLEYGLTWYERANGLCSKLGAKYGVSTAQACGVMAALSPGSQWERNIADCEIFLDEWSDGSRDKDLPLVGSYGWRNIVKASKIASGKDPLEVLGGNKVRAFYECLVNPSHDSAVCVDRHAKSAAYGVKMPDTAIVRPSEYEPLAKHYRAIAKKIGVLPLQGQAVIWGVWRRLDGVLIQADLDLTGDVPF